MNYLVSLRERHGDSERVEQRNTRSQVQLPQDTNSSSTWVVSTRPWIIQMISGERSRHDPCVIPHSGLGTLRVIAVIRSQKQWYEASGLGCHQNTVSLNRRASRHEISYAHMKNTTIHRDNHFVGLLHVSLQLHFHTLWITWRSWLYSKHECLSTRLWLLPESPRMTLSADVWYLNLFTLFKYFNLFSWRPHTLVA